MATVMRKVSITLFVFFISLAAMAQVKMKNPDDDTHRSRHEQGSDSTQQKRPKSDFRKNLRVGGNFGAMLGTSTYLQLTPVAAYMINDRWLAGTSVTYIYQSVRYSPTSKYTTNIYGGSFLTRYMITDGLFVNAEYEALNLDYYDPNSTYHGRRWVGSLLAGAGYISGGSADFRGPYLMVLYNLNNTIYSPYNNGLIFRVGMLF